MRCPRLLDEYLITSSGKEPKLRLTYIIAREKLSKKDEESMWAKPSPFVDKEDLQKHIEATRGRASYLI